MRKRAVEQNVPKPRSMDVLIPLIQRELLSADAVDLDYCRKVAELLWELKSDLRGRYTAGWQFWLHKYFKLTEQTARRWMALVGRFINSATYFRFMLQPSPSY